MSRQQFTPGALVRWKPALRNKAWPRYEQPAIVIEQLAKPVVDELQDSSTPYYREPLDLVLGVYDNEGDLAVIYYDSRRFEPITL